MSTTTVGVGLSDTIAMRQEREGGSFSLDRAEVIAAIRAALRARTGRAWSVTGGKGTAWGWISVTAPPKRRTGGYVDRGERDACGDVVYVHEDVGAPGYLMTPDDQAALSDIFGRQVSAQHYSIPADRDFWIAAVQTAEGRSLSVNPTPYWD